MKADLVELILTELRSRMERLAKAALDAHEAATDPGSKAESKYDTRNLEESYLATGQAKQVKELAQTIGAFENLKLEDSKKGDSIQPGALVELVRKGGKEKAFFLLAPASGGLEVLYKRKVITLLSPESPLYRNLLGLGIGDSLEAPPFNIVGIK